MTSTRWCGLIVTVLAVAVVGCGCDGGTDRITALENANRVLTQDNAEMENKLARCHQRQSELGTDLMGARADLSQAQRDVRLAEEQARAAQEALAGIGAGGGDPAPGWVATTAGHMITVGSDILFASGKAELTNEGKRRLDQIAGDLQSSYSGRTVRVVGHTDGDPIRRTRNLWTDNLDLSSNRAMAVTRYLVGQGVSLQRIETVGMADSRPVASNSTTDGKARNRRVEILAVN
jgi:outer membrane protein OmpA-like peptidoglycan-associated protein